MEPKIKSAGATPPVSAQKPAAEGETPAVAPGGPPPTRVLVVLTVLTVLLMAFSIVAGLMGNATLAATAGAGAVALIGEIARRLLSGQV